MHTFSRLALTLGTALLPASAFAAVSTPAELTALINADLSPRSFSAEFHSESDGVYGTAWINGSQKGSMLDPSAQMKMTVDVAVPQYTVTVRTKMEMRVISSTVYATLGSITGNYDNALLSAVLSITGKQWIKAEIPGEVLELLRTIQTGEDAPGNELFDMTSRPVAAGTEYTLTLKEGMTLDGLTGNDDYTNFEFLGRRVRRSRMSLTTVVVMSPSGKFVSSSMQFGSSDGDTTVKGTMTAKALASMPAVVAPTNAMTWQEVADTVAPDFLDHSGDTPENWDLPDEDFYEWEEPVTEGSGCVTNRRTLCGNKPNYRSLRHR